MCVVALPREQAIHRCSRHSRCQWFALQLCCCARLASNAENAGSRQATALARSPCHARPRQASDSHSADELGAGINSGAMAGGRLTGDYLTGKLGRGHLVCYGALLAAAGLVFVLLVGHAGWALV